MFSGIVEAIQPILSATVEDGVVRVTVQRPAQFDDIKIGDSISMNGVCLTVEAFAQQSVQFAMGVETQKILGANDPVSFSKVLVGRQMNLERSLKFGDRVHGHLVTGHVETLAEVLKTNRIGDNLQLEVLIPKTLKSLLWKKGSVALNGVSLTINEVSMTTDGKNFLSVGLIPETIKRTNLGSLKSGDQVSIEPDYLARAIGQRLLSEMGSGNKEASLA